MERSYLSQKNSSQKKKKKGLVEWLKVGAKSASPRTEGKRKVKKNPVF
jgi:hypothetical protein